MSPESASPNRPFRWDLVRRDQLGSLLADCAEPDLWFLDELIDCAAKVLARSADGELYFVGRSADSVFDLLGGALSHTSWRDRLHQVPLSLYGLAGIELSRAETRQLRTILNASGISPATLTRRRHPVVFVDLVYQGSTFENLYHVLRDWIDDERAQWDVARLKLHFVGITWRTSTSPKTWRWQQHAAWTSDLPAQAVRNISLDGVVWSYFGDRQPKVTPSFHRRRWSEEGINSPRHDAQARMGLAEAVALVERGREPATRRRLVRRIGAEPTIAESWLRSLAGELRGAPRGREDRP